MLEIIKYFVVPSGLIIICCISGFVLLFTRRVRRIATLMLAVAATFYIVFGNGPVSLWLLGNLEYQYPPLTSIGGLEDVDAIVILAGHGETDLYLPISSKVNSASAFRIMEALRLFRILPDAKIVLSGCGNVPQIMKRLLVSLGVPSNRVAIEDRSANTYESAVNMQKRFADGSFVLVTSAVHMPRAMSAFHKLGMNPIPAPTNYMSIKNYRAIAYLPSPLHLKYSDLALHEYLGILWYRLTHRL